MNGFEHVDQTKFKLLSNKDIQLLGSKMRIERKMQLKEENNENSEMEYIPNSNKYYTYKKMGIQNIKESIFPKNRENSDYSSSIETSPFSNEGINIIDFNEDLINNDVTKSNIPEFILIKYANNEEKVKIGQELINEEVNWIIFQRDLDFNNEDLKNVLRKILELHKIDFYDIPFIATYYQDLYSDYFNYDDIFDILTFYDVEFIKFSQDKNIILLQFEEIKQYMSENEKVLFKEQFISNCYSNYDLNLIKAYFSFLSRLNKEEIKKKEIEILLINRVKYNNYSKFENCIEINYKIIVNKFMLSLPEIEENFNYYSKGEFEKIKEAPFPNNSMREIASQFISNNNIQEIEILTETAKYIACLLGNYPSIRKLLYDYFFDNTILNTNPTEKGKQVLTVFHPCFRCKRIKNKKISDFFYLKNKGIYEIEKGELFLEIEDCVKEGLITMELKIEKNQDKYAELAKQFSMSINGIKEDTEYSNKKNPEERKSQYIIMRDEAIRLLINDEKYIKSEFLEDIKKQLYDYSIKCIMRKAVKNFHDLIANNYFGDNPNKGNIISLYINPKNPNKVSCVILNENGIHVNCYEFKFIAEKLTVIQNLQDKINYSEEIALFKKIINQNKPIAIVISANDLNAYNLYNVIHDNISIEYQNIIFSSYIYLLSSGNSIICELDDNVLAEQQGRFIQNPVTEILSLWDYSYNKNEILNLRLHKFKNYIIEIDFYCYLLENVIKKVLNQRGIDFDLMINVKALNKEIYFINGSGYYIGDKLLKSLITEKKDIINRKGLKRLLKENEKLFDNINGFIYFNNNNKKQYLEKTRIPYQLYDQFYQEIGNLVSIQDLNEKIFNSSFDFIINLLKVNDRENQNNFKLNFFVNEIISPFNTEKEVYISQSYKDIFLMLINDSRSLRNNSIKTAITEKIDEENKTIICNIFERNRFIPAYLKFENTDNNIQDFKKGYIFNCKIISIEFESLIKYEINITSKINEIKNFKSSIEEQINSNLFNDFEFEEEDFINKDIELIENIKKDVPEDKIIKFKNDNILINNNFKKINYDTALNEFKNKQPGDFIFRPCFKEGYITLTYKLDDDILNNKYIKIKEDENHKTSFEFEDNDYNNIEELIHFFNNSYVKKIKSIISNKHYIKGNSIENFINEVCNFGQLNIPINQLPFYFSFLPDFPDYAILGIYSNVNYCNIEFIKIENNYFLFHNEKFEIIEKIISYLKKNYLKKEYIEYQNRTPFPIYFNELRKIEESFPKFEENYIDNNFYYLNNDNDFNSNNYSYENKRNSNLGKKRDRNNNQNNNNNFNNYDSNNINYDTWETSNNNNNNNDGWGPSNNNNNDTWEQSNNNNNNNDGWASSNNNNNDNWEHSNNNNNNNDGWASSNNNNNDNWEHSNNNNFSDNWVNSNNNYKNEGDDWATSNSNDFTFNDNKSIKKEQSFRHNNNNNRGKRNMNRGGRRDNNNRGRDRNRGNKRNFNGGRGNKRGFNNNDNNHNNNFGNLNKKTNCFDWISVTHSNNNNNDYKESNNGNNYDWGSSNNNKGNNNEWGTSNNNNNDNGWDTSNNNNNDNGWGSSNNDKWDRPNNNNNHEGRTSNNDEWGTSNNNNNGWETSNNNEWGSSNNNNNNGWETSNNDEWGSSNNINNSDKGKTSNNNEWGESNKNNNNNNGWDTSKNDEWGSSNNNNNNGWGTSNNINNNNKGRTSNNDEWGTSNNNNNNGWDTSNNNEWGSPSGDNNNNEGRKSNNYKDNNNEWGSSNNDGWRTSNDNNNNNEWDTSNNNNNNEWGTSNNNDWKTSNNNEWGTSNNNGWGTPNNNNDNNNMDISNNNFNNDWNSNYNFSKNNNNYDNKKKTYNKDNNKQKGACFNCGEVGHKSRDCPNKNNKQKGACFKCGEVGHKSKDCPNKDNKDNNKQKSGCFNCGEEGHKLRDCPNKNNKQKGACFNCGEVGHKSRDCPNKDNNNKNQCKYCHETDHNSYECPNKKTKFNNSKDGCYFCGSKDHFAKYCPNQNNPFYKKSRANKIEDGEVNIKNNDEGSFNWGSNNNNDKENDNNKEMSDWGKNNNQNETNFMNDNNNEENNNEWGRINNNEDNQNNNDKDNYGGW